MTTTTEHRVVYTSEGELWTRTPAGVPRPTREGESCQRKVSVHQVQAARSQTTRAA